MKIRKHQQGFSTVEALLILVIIGILGFVGWFVWHSQKVTDKAYSGATNDSTQKTSPIKTYAECEKAAGSKTLLTYPAQCITKSGKIFTDTSQKYLVIKEWGVKLPLTVGIQDTYYIVKPDHLNSAYLSLASLKDTQCSASNITLGAIARFRVEDMNELTGKSILSESPDAGKVGDFYYHFVRTQSACDTGNVQLPLDVDFASEWTRAIKQIQAD